MSKTLIVESNSEPPSDAGKPSDSKRLLGQVNTPHDIGLFMIKQLKINKKRRHQIKILDAGCGPGTFAKILDENQFLNEKDQLVGVDIDPTLVEECKSLKLQLSFKFKLFCADFIQANFGVDFDHLLMNPPYVRQEWIQEKNQYRDIINQLLGFKPMGTSNLYSYFMYRGIEALKPGGTFSVIFYDSIGPTKFGKQLTDFIEKSCDNVVFQKVRTKPFDTELIDAVIVTGIKSQTLKKNQTSPELQRKNFKHGWAAIGDIFNTKRGLRLKQTKFFLTDGEYVDNGSACRFLKRVRKTTGFKISKDHPEGALLIKQGEKNTETLEEIQRRFKDAKKHPEIYQSVLNWQKNRPETWFYHPLPPVASLVFNYYIRHQPKHLLNADVPYSDNFYGLNWEFDLTPFGGLALMNSLVVQKSILQMTRNQGGGLKKIQLFEYRDVAIPDPRIMSKHMLNKLDEIGKKMTKNDNWLEKELDILLSGYQLATKKGQKNWVG